MRGNKTLGIALWLLGLLLANVLLFCLERGLTATFWITFAFVWVAFLYVLVFQLLVWKHASSPDEQFLHIPAMTVSFVYLLLQIPLCVIFALGSARIPYKAALLINALLLIAAWILALGSIAGNDHIRRVNGRQKDNHTKLL